MNESFAAGIIPFTFDNRKPIILLGLEKSNNKWSGFVGGSEKNETPMQTALREFNEETSFLFNLEYFHLELLTTRPIIEKTATGKTVYLWFIQCPPCILSTDFKKFHDNQKVILDPHLKEKSKLRWFTLNDIRNFKVLYRLQQTILKNFTINGI